MKKISSKKEQVFVTGANGKIGRKLVTKLLDKNYRVIALVRNKNKLLLKHPNLEIIESDILQPNNYRNKIRECDYVYHLAAYQNISDQNMEEFVRVNVEGTRAILGAAIKSRVKRIVYLSTVMVFKSKGEKEVDEKSPKKTSGNGNHYVETKLLALKVIKELKTKVPVITLYPTIVIDFDEIVGQADKPPDGWQGFLWKMVGGGVPGGLMGMVGSKKRMMNYILMDNLIMAMINATTKGKAGENYILGGENITVENYLRQALRIKGRAFLPVRFPTFLLKIISLLNIPKLNFINFIAKNPPGDICVNSQKAVDHLRLKITKLKDCYS